LEIENAMNAIQLIHYASNVIIQNAIILFVLIVYYFKNAIIMIIRCKYGHYHLSIDPECKLCGWEYDLWMFDNFDLTEFINLN
jgi:hypothetical protein